MKNFLTAFSYIFHPLFISVYAVLIYFFFGKHFYSYPEIYFVLIQIVLLTILIPITIYYLLLSLGKVDSIMMASKSQRIIPLFIHCLLLLFIIKRSITIDVFYELYFFFSGCLISSIGALLAIFLQSKASLHMIGITALTTFTMGNAIHFQTDLTVLICVLIVCCGCVATSRLVMKAHTISELIIGAIIGTLPQIGLFYLWL